MGELRACLLIFFVLAAHAVGETSLSTDTFTTPRELIVRLFHDGDIRTDPAYAAAHQRWRLETATRVVEPRPNSSPLRKPLERAWTLRFSRNIPLDAARREYASLPGVLWAESNRLHRTFADEIVPDDPQWDELWNLADIDMPRAWAIEQGDPSVVIAVVDTGSTVSHDDLQGQLWTNPGEIVGNGRDDDGNGFIDDVHGWDFVHAPTTAGAGDFQDPDDDPTDETGHGTHVSGILLAAPNNGTGVAGVAWNCRLMVVRSGFAARGGGTFLQEDDSAAGIVYAAENGASVINMSWGDERGSFLLRDTLRYAASLGVTLVGATGNDSLTQIVYPAAFPEVIAVAASGKEGEAAYFTNGNPEADIAAPGVSVLSLHIDNGLRVLSGTSMASPHVAGVAALMRAKRPGLTNEEIRRFLITTAEPLTLDRVVVGVPKLNAPNALIVTDALIAEFDRDMPPGADRGLRVVGSVGGPTYDGYRLSLGESISPTMFAPLFEAHGVESAGSRRLLFEWDTANLNEGVYVLRLETFDADGTFARDQRLVTVDHTPPRWLDNGLRHPLFAPALARGARRLMGWSVTDDAGFTAVTFHDSATGVHRGTLTTPTPRLHFVYDAGDLVPPGSWSYDVRVLNLAGLESSMSGEIDTAVFRPSPANRTPLEGRSLPPLDVAARTADFNGNGLPELIGSTPGAEGFIFTQIFEPRDGVGLRSVHLFPTFFTPLDVGDLDGDGLMEILGREDGALVIYEAANTNAFPSQRRALEPNLSAGRYFDLDNDGRVELLARRGASTLVVVQSTGDNQFAVVSELRNPTDNGGFLTASYAVGDFRGARELFVGDSDGELIGFRVDAGQLIHTFTQQTTHSRILDAAATSTGGLAILGEDDFGVKPRDGRFGAVALYRWNGDEFRVAGNQEPAIVWLRDPDEDARLIASATEPTLAVVSAGWAYVLEPSDETGLALTWASPATRTAYPAFLDVTGDGRDELLFNAQGFLNVVTSEPSAVRDIAPFGLVAEPVNEARVRLTWERADPSRPSDIYRAVGDAEPMLLDTIIGDEYDDLAVRVGAIYRYEIGVGDARSEPASVFIAQQPGLIGAEAMTATRVRLSFTEPMGPSARIGERYVVSGAGTRIAASSALRIGDGNELVLTLADALTTGDYIVEAILPSDMRSDDNMPLDTNRAVASFRFVADESGYADLSQLRVYPNPVRLARHSAKAAFDRLPEGATVGVYSADGGRVAEGVVADGETSWTWQLQNAGFAPVAPGVYVYVVGWDGLRRVGKMAVVR